MMRVDSTNLERLPGKLGEDDCELTQGHLPWALASWTRMTVRRSHRASI
jgi:hypothetical protein